MSRTIEDINKEYANAAMALGQLTYQIAASNKAISALEQEANRHSNKMEHLNKEALRLQKREEEPKEVPSETAAQPESN